MVVDGGGDVVEARAVAGGAAGLAAQDLVAAAVGDAAEFLDVDVDQFTGLVAFVAADDLSGGPVQVGELVQAVPGEDALHGRGGQAQDRSQACGSELAALVRWGVVRGRLEQSKSPLSPSDRRRRSHLWAVGRKMPISAATCATGRSARTRSMSSRLP
ncbi:hypothetical protein GCM10022295_92470 [Streptomyces osmaniensis]|uniref:Uncharacterized protein n=1 Tax=Streptomyces osmaniensis TaxID=593134 RepID=A0ABP6Z596_9ACTN